MKSDQRRDIEIREHIAVAHEDALGDGPDRGVKNGRVFEIGNAHAPAQERARDRILHAELRGHLRIVAGIERRADQAMHESRMRDFD